MANPNIIQLSEFDIAQKIIESLSNVCTRTVLFSIKSESKDATQNIICFRGSCTC